ncbi:hypothetical protein C8R46DRAFT_901721, partial [Mycena filopes]
LLALLECTRGIVSGSAVLRMVTNLDFKPGDLDIYVPDSQEETAINLCTERLGFQLTMSMDPLYDTNTSLGTVHWLAKGTFKLNVMVVKGENAALAIFQFHSTIVMNFLTANGLYCAYPTLTLSNLAIPNRPIMRREGGFSQRCRDCFEKYRGRGVTYQTDARDFPGHAFHTCFVDSECPMTLRSTRDGRGAYRELFPPSQLEVELQNEHRYLTVWMLGGPHCMHGEDFQEEFSASIKLREATVSNPIPGIQRPF